MRASGLEALVLNVRDYRETSAMVQFFTREEGRLTGVMRGLRRGRNQSGVQPFCAGVLSISGHGLYTVTQFETVRRYELHGDALTSGFYVLELVTRGLAEGQSDEAVFVRTLELLEHIAQPDARLAPLLRAYEQDYLAALGYGVDFSGDDESQPLSATSAYEWLPETGFRKTTNDGIPGSALLAIAAGDFATAAVQRHARHLHRLALRPLLGDKPLVSQSLLGAPGRSPGE